MTSNARRSEQNPASIVDHLSGPPQSLIFLLCFSVFALPAFLFVVTPLGTTVPLIIARICAIYLIITSVHCRNRFYKFVRQAGRTECILLTVLVLLFGLSLFHSHISQRAVLEYFKILIGVLLYLPLRALIRSREIHEFGYLAILGTIICGALILTNNLLYHLTDDKLNLVAPVFHRHGEIFLSVIIWPTALICKTIYTDRKLLLLLLIPFLAIVTGDNQSSQLALFCGLIVYCATWFAGRLTTIVSMIVITVLVLGLNWWLPVVAQIGSLESMSSFFGRGDADVRLSIWLAFIDVIKLKFWLGWGFEAWRGIQDLVGQKQYLDWHPHNAFIEIWITMGLLGALAIVVFELFLVIGIYRLENSVRPYFLATLVTVNVIAFISHGWLQVWWIESLFIAAILLLPLADFANDSRNIVQPGEKS